MVILTMDTLIQITVTKIFKHTKDLVAIQTAHTNSKLNNGKYGK